jgi:hypothetical protein
MGVTHAVEVSAASLLLFVFRKENHIEEDTARPIQLHVGSSIAITSGVNAPHDGIVAMVISAGKGPRGAC